jgi:hypothetical protein
VDDASSVHLLFGSDTGLTATGSESWSQDSTDIEGTAKEDDSFGSSLAAADLGGDAHADLAVGEDTTISGFRRWCGPRDLRIAGRTDLHRQSVVESGSPGVKGNAQKATLGASLAASNFDNGDPSTWPSAHPTPRWARRDQLAPSMCFTARTAASPPQ